MGTTHHIWVTPTDAGKWLMECQCCKAQREFVDYDDACRAAREHRCQT